MSAAEGNSPHSFLIKTARITAERAGSRAMDIREAIVEINLYEHLEHPYMTGTLLIADTVDIYGLGDFQGTEKFEFEAVYSERFPGPSGSVKKSFIITSIDSMMKGNDNSEIIAFSLTEEHYFKNQMDTINKSYDGKPIDIIRNIIGDGNLGVTIDTLNDTGIQEPLRYIAPYLTPLDAALRVMESAITEDGYPFYLYSVLGSENLLYYRNLKQIFLEDPISNEPFSYALYKTGLSDSRIASIVGGDINDPRNSTNQTRGAVVELEERSRVIEKYHITNQQNIISLFNKGHIGHTREFVNINQFNYHTHKHDMSKVYDRLENFLPSDQKRTGLDEVAQGGLHLKNSKYITQIFSSHTYTTNINNLYDQGSTLASYLGLYATRDAIKAFMEKSAINVEIPGYHFWPNGSSNPNRTIGRKIPLQFFNNDLEGGEKPSKKVIDKNRSGEYLIYAASHQFGLTKYKVSLTCVKYSNQDL